MSSRVADRTQKICTGGDLAPRRRVLRIHHECRGDDCYYSTWPDQRQRLETEVVVHRMIAQVMHGSCNFAPENGTLPTTASNVSSGSGVFLESAAVFLVQEALTNVVKHVGPSARAEVTVDRCQDRLVVEVRDFGSALASRKATGSGLGLHNMRERAALVGGTLRAGPSATGFLVQLVIPLGAGVHGQYALQKR
jgi:hypothetical protein